MTIQEANKRIYYFLLGNPKSKNRKLRWTISIILQELLMGKYKAVLKYYFKPSYRKDINILRDKLAPYPLKAVKTTLGLRDIQKSHEINYPVWVDKLITRLEKGEKLPPLKVIRHNNYFLVVDGNHRLQALNYFHKYADVTVDVLILNPIK